MESEAKIIIAFLFNRSGKTALKDTELYLPLSMELGWFSTKEAQEFVKYSLKKELLIKKDGLLHPIFPVEKTSIPVGFTPTKKLFSEKKKEQKKENILEEIVAQITSQTNRSHEDILKEITSEEKEKNILPEVAVLYLTRKYNVDMTDWYDVIEQKLFKGNTG
jgi:hypothetical protein